MEKCQINGALAQGNDVFRLEGDKWKQSYISANVRRVMKCQNKGYVLSGDSTSRTQYISELENSRQVLATLPEDHLLVDVSTIGHKDKIFVVGGGDADWNASQAVIDETKEYAVRTIRVFSSNDSYRRRNL